MLEQSSQFPRLSIFSKTLHICTETSIYVAVIDENKMIHVLVDVLDLVADINKVVEPNFQVRRYALLVKRFCIKLRHLGLVLVIELVILVHLPPLVKSKVCLASLLRNFHRMYILL